VPEPAPSPVNKPAKVDDGKMTTSLRIRPEVLSALKVLAVQRRCRVNDLILEAIDNHLALNGQRAAA
jgi:predicted HicB family RNase H-like nuclease